MSERIGMICKLAPQELKGIYTFDKIDSDDIDGLSVSMLDAFKDTVDFNGETIEELNKEICSIVESTFGTFISDASFQIKQNGEIAAVILISLFKGKPFVSELFTVKKYLKQGMASNLLKNSINVLGNLGYDDLILYVHPKNAAAVNLYKKIGFIEL
ncbi:GNAT family N-acetyltransferase [Clostridium beijerinckii]|uniref:GNAT family N-acetyltransferase n=1 Tax=Clostridium beijerinckii TaxID=1520 RepID=A0AAW3WBG7_CLOBE|nr:GNAT family N-acetyltransferase [Clostridium beijerinckii]MBC2458784.1 GNAT family N-acetyltransferase [Clostridium beijerinckii]MBC2476246.1 GNAT family N-acetyltransferase [Clostridium beijerinckii]NOV61268.1 ribosomal protein S18 acetylase RimI-like enzyme [Clostridium beijerinckii]NOV69239.1 ribosomal protein S18 acetylase RimI-like enzyme [Clostridium beijerinckii]NOW32866.1 ribosomal protein S18 acetylase RimI-like enzyme [Clostridium beijerinckii]